MELQEAIVYARRVAFKMNKNPEMEEVACLAAWKAVRTYDPSRAVPFKRYLALLVKRRVYDWQGDRRRQPKTQTDEWWAANEPAIQMLVAADEYSADFQMLVEYYIDKWPLDVLARRHGVSIYKVRKLLRAATARFLHRCTHGR